MAADAGTPYITPHMRFRILTRYVLREHVGPLVFALSALTTLLLLNQVAKQFGNLVGKGLSWGVIGEFFLLTLPFIIAMTLPMAVLVAVLYAFSRFSAENEVTALRASGVSMMGLVRPVLVAGIVVAVANLLFNDQVLPRANHRLRSLQTDIARKKPTFALRAQVINEVMPGRLFLRAGRLDEATSGMREVTIFNFDDPTRRKTIYADSGRMELTPDQRDLVLTLHDGYMQQIPQANLGELQRLYFTTDLVRVRNIGNKFEETSKDTYKSEREMSVCEMDSMYQKAYHEEKVARADLEGTMLAAVHFAATGEHAPAVPEPRPLTRRTLGSLYCRLVKRISPRVEPAEAAEPRASQTPQTPRARQMPQTPVKRPPMPGLPPAQSGTTRVPPRSPSSGGYRGAPTVYVNPGGPQQQGTTAAKTFAQTLARVEIAGARVNDARTTASRYAVEIQKKFALAAACAVFVLLGAPVGLRFPRGGVGMVLGVSIGVFGLYYVGLVAGEAMADRLVLTPFWGMWMANVLFTVTGLVLMAHMQRSGATARGGEWREALQAARERRAARRAARRSREAAPSEVA